MPFVARSKPAMISAGVKPRNSGSLEISEMVEEGRGKEEVREREKEGGEGGRGGVEGRKEERERERRRGSRRRESCIERLN